MKRGIWLLLCLFFLGACSAEDKPVSKEKEQEEQVMEAEGGAEAEEAAETVPAAPLTIEEMVVQDPGKLVEEHLDPELEVMQGLELLQYHKFMDNEFKPIIEKELTAYFGEENKEFSAREVYDYLVYQLGSGRYRTYYNQLVNFEHGHVMPELPDGADEVEKIAKQKQTNVAILLDASGSMKAEAGGRPKMELAKEAIRKFTGQLGENVHVSLIAYGHEGSGSDADQQKSCAAIETFYPLSSYKEGSFQQSLDAFSAVGWTPLAGAMEEAHKLLSGYDGEQYKNVVYVVSDGVETCNGNPVEAAKKLHESNIEAKVNIIGFDVDDEGQKQLKEVAEAGAGEYATVKDGAEFEEVILKKWKPSIFQVIAQQGIMLHEVVDQMERLNDVYIPLTYASDRENNRVATAAYFLRDKKWISDETRQEVSDMANIQNELRKNHFKKLKDEKDAEAQQARDAIDQRVEEWRNQRKDEL